MATGPAAIIVEHFENATDPRVNRGDNYPLMELMFLALTAAICGANGWADVERFAQSKLQWFRQFIRLKRGVLSHDTFGRVFARLDTAGFLTAMHAWVDTFAGSLHGRGVAIDGTSACLMATVKRTFASEICVSAVQNSHGNQSLIECDRPD